MAKAQCDARDLQVGRSILPGFQSLRVALAYHRAGPVTARRLRLLAGFTWLQAAIQALAALSGLLLVRVLEKPQFAAYTIATSLLTTLNVLTDCGIGTGLN